MFAFFDGLEEVLGGFFGKAREGEKLLGGEGVEVGGAAGEFVVDEEFDDGFAEAFDIHCLAGGEVNDAADDLCRAVVGVGALERDAVPLKARRAAWTVSGWGDGDFVALAEVDLNAYNGGDDFACFFDGDEIVDADVFAADFVEVVEGGAGDAGAG